MNAASLMPTLLLVAWLLPLLSFALICVGYSVLQFARRPITAAAAKISSYIACAAIVIGFVCSLAVLGIWLQGHGLQSADAHHSKDQQRAAIQDPIDQVMPVALSSEPKQGPVQSLPETDPHSANPNAHETPSYYAGEWYTLCEFGKLKLAIGYHIDALTVVMFCMVTFVASCVHFYSIGYMHDELDAEWVDTEVTLDNGEPLKRAGRFFRFFQYLSLFSFSMLGLVIAGNMAMVFIFWELVGICSYFLIGFYIERKSASNAANKAFIVNRIGDFGMLIGMMALWTSLGTFTFGDMPDHDGHVEQGVFSLLRKAENDHRLEPADGMVKLSARDEVGKIVLSHAGEPNDTVHAEHEIESKIATWRTDPEKKHGHWLLFVAGVGIFCGCVGKSAQFPLHVWLPDAMEGPTPVSALVHSATMVAAGVYLVGRFYPAFTPEVLLVIAYVGCFTLFMAATIAVTATDIKRVLAYSTISQLGYMMLALGVGGWIAGLFHLITHAFFKGLLFLCSGSVIHAVHSNEMTEMGGLRKKMPITAYTMLIGCLAIIGAGIPFVIGFSGYYSKDAILEQAYSFMQVNPTHGVLFFAAAGGAAITAFYMFRLWYMTFAGKPRNQHRYDHAHESPRTITVPLILLAIFAVMAGWKFPGIGLDQGVLPTMLEQARPEGTLPTTHGTLLTSLTIPNEHDSHVPAIQEPATWIAFSTALAGFLLATIMYAWRKLDPEEARRQFKPIHRFLLNKWWFDELYDWLFVRPTHLIAKLVTKIDGSIIDAFVHTLARLSKRFAVLWDRVVDQGLVDRSLNQTARMTWGFGLGLRRFQTGSLRQYIMFIVLGTVVIFLMITFIWNLAIAG